ncbi:hypothetical protein FGO68_gene13811 [Halteria grandinella]|uniref:Uncharacterized protein n=1 Tax=Halteria grandinella TaxID=5974 RepID=A0A8J8NGB5_HALGN|nr:hypothetical protein FGO68_gene13811 [Halteria grandinella]
MLLLHRFHRQEWAASLNNRIRYLTRLLPLLDFRATCQEKQKMKKVNSLTRAHLAVYQRGRLGKAVPKGQKSSIYLQTYKERKAQLGLAQAWKVNRQRYRPI